MLYLLSYDLRAVAVSGGLPRLLRKGKTSVPLRGFGSFNIFLLPSTDTYTLGNRTKLEIFCYLNLAHNTQVFLS